MYSVYTKLCVSLGPSAQGWRPKVLNFKDTHFLKIYQNKDNNNLFS